jgi:hypothetical protein
LIPSQLFNASASRYLDMKIVVTSGNTAPPLHEAELPPTEAWHSLNVLRVASACEYVNTPASTH